MSVKEKFFERAIQKRPSFDLKIEPLEIQGFEKVFVIREHRVGLEAIIAIHSTVLGNAVGGTRCYPYPSFDEALTDVLRLAEGMTYKTAIAEVGLGGGKSVIIADPKTEKTEELLLAFAEAVDRLGGIYICAEDMGTTPFDMSVIARGTKYVVGLPESSGDPGRYTAWGTYRGIQAVCQVLFGSSSVEGRTVALQGLGNVGAHLAETLFWQGAKLFITDIDPVKVSSFAKRFHAVAVAPDSILDVPCDIFAPCARGGIINKETIHRLSCKGIAGSANNQLLEVSDAVLLDQRQILYAPDFVINAGGLYNVAQELEKYGYDAQGPRDKVTRIYDHLLALFEIAQERGLSTQEAALQLAKHKIGYGIGKRAHSPYFHAQGSPTS